MISTIFNHKLVIMEETELRRILSANIKYYRGLRKWSQAVLAEKIGISNNFLADIETGKSWVSSSTLVKLVNIFEIDAHELFKSQKTPKDETKEVIKSIVDDITVIFGNSVKDIADKYLDIK